MQDFTVRSVQIRPESLRAALKELDAAINTHSQMKQLIEQLLSLQEGIRSGRPAGSGRPGRPGRPAGSGAPGRGRRPRGEKTLRQAIVEVLSRNKGILKPIELKKKVLESGYQTTATDASFYTAVFNTARNEPGVTKTKQGFEIKGSGVGAKSTTKKKARGRPRKKK